MERGNTIRNKAEDLAELAYEKWGKTGIPRYLVGFKVDKSADADSVIAKLADYLEQNMLARYPEDTYTERLDATLDAAKDEDLLELISRNKSIDPRTVEYAAFKPLYEPTDGPDWYGMSPAELRLNMVKLGYDPDKGGQPELARFLEALRTNAQRYERTKGVEEDMGDWRTVMASLVSPSATEEAVKQSITGQFDDDKMNRAVSVDYLVNSLMGAGLTGAVKVPDNLVRGLGLPATVELAANPQRAAFIAGSLEGARQMANAAEGREASLGAVGGSAFAAGTVPAAAQMLASYIARGTSPTSKVFSRGMARGLRNYDPVAMEREALKEQLIRARQLNKSMPASTTDGSNSGVSYAQMAATEDLQDIIDKLRFLGYKSSDELPLNMKIKPFTVEDVIGQSTATKMGRPANIAPLDERPTPTLSTIRDDPDRTSTLVYDPNNLTVDNSYSLIEDALTRYDTPHHFLQGEGTSQPGLAAPKPVYKANKGAYEQGKAMFPAKTEAEIASGTDATTYEKGRRFGEILNALFGRVEPITRVNLLSPTDLGASLRGLKERQWYQDAVKATKKKKSEEE